MESTPTLDNKNGNETESSKISSCTELMGNMKVPGNSTNTMENTTVDQNSLMLERVLETENLENENVIVSSEGNVVPVASTSDDSKEGLFTDKIIKISKLSSQVSAKELYILLHSFGSIEDVYIRIDSSPPNNHIGFITFKYPEDANWVLKFGKPLYLRGSALEFSLALQTELDDPPSIQDNSEIDNTPINSMYRLKRSLIIREVKGVCDGKEILDAGDQNSKIGKLDKKYLVKIFSYLNTNDLKNIAKVCKRWSVLVNEAWNNVTKLDGNVDPELFQSSFRLEQVLTRCGGSVKEICVGSENIITPSFYSVISKHSTQLESLTIEKNCTQTESLQIIANNCVGLKKLIIRNCVGLTDEGLSSIFETNPGIETLILQDETIRGKCLVSGLHRLKSLSLIKCKLLRPKHVLQVLENTTVQVEKLELIECFKFLERHIVRTMLRSPDVKTLIIDGAYFGNDVLMYPVFHMTFLRKISLSFSNAITPELIYGLKEHCLQLRDINLDGLGECNSRMVNPNVFNILGQITQLQHLSISYSPLINNASLSTFLPNLTNLKTARFAACMRMDAISVPNTLLACPNLEFIDFSGSLRSRRILFARLVEKIDKLIERETKTDVWIGEFFDIYTVEEDDIPDIGGIHFTQKSSLDGQPVESNFDHYLWDTYDDSDNESIDDIVLEDHIY